MSLFKSFVFPKHQTAFVCVVWEREGGGGGGGGLLPWPSSSAIWHDTASMFKKQKQKVSGLLIVLLGSAGGHVEPLVVWLHITMLSTLSWRGMKREREKNIETEKERERERERETDRQK